MQVVILCGGKGTRLREKTESLPKPLVEIGGDPIVWHVMRWYAHYGIRRFLLATGYMGDRIAGWLGTLQRDGRLDGLDVQAVDTGLETQTGGRIQALADRLEGPFLCTYADGLTDLALPHLLATHAAAGTIGTLTAIRPLSQFGILALEGGLVRRFIEKPQLQDWINGGFFVFQPEFLDYLSPTAILEQEPLARLAAEGQLAAHRHDGFWACMDTYKDHERLDGLWHEGRAPWKVWED